ncbi:LppU/SCO3897 family protein [Streptomyces gardneri]|uniref:LppU/SCO3897 family protein n=1 Tax=Streptomyces gardneri TaxID=66892 RepID=UPI0036CA068D
MRHRDGPDNDPKVDTTDCSSGKADLFKVVKVIDDTFDLAKCGTELSALAQQLDSDKFVLATPPLTSPLPPRVVSPPPRPSGERVDLGLGGTPMDRDAYRDLRESRSGSTHMRRTATRLSNQEIWSHGRGTISAARVFCWARHPSLRIRRQNA